MAEYPEPGLAGKVLLDHRELELLVVLGHEKTPKVGVQLYGVSSLVGLFFNIMAKAVRFAYVPQAAPARVRAWPSNLTREPRRWLTRFRQAIKKPLAGLGGEIRLRSAGRPSASTRIVFESHT
jgi:hypothetical protein